MGLPPNVEQADFVSSGVFGLIDAIEKFDIGREIKFGTYAITRIRGAMIDELRALDWIPRSVRREGAQRRAGLRDARGQAAADALGERGRREMGVALENCMRFSASWRSRTSWRSRSCCTSRER